VISAVVLGCLWAGVGYGRDQDVRDAIVKIYTVHNRPNYYNPWSMYGPRRTTGSGCVIEKKRILTNAHVVSHQTFIQVRKNGDAKRYQAQVLAVSHEADLALLTVDDESFFDDVRALKFDGLPNTQQEVLVYGFPLGGDTLSITKGVLSRIEHQTYAHSSCNFLAGQIDAAINPGNSGGPVIVGTEIVGVVMQSISSAENIGYMVPMPIIEHFMDDIEDGAYDGFPSIGVVMQDMENPSLRSRHEVPEDTTGVLVTRILVDSPADGVLQTNDVITALAGHDVANDGTVEFRADQRTAVSYFVQEIQIGGSIDVTILREGEEMEMVLDLDRSLREDFLVQLEVYDTLPTYYIFGGIVFCPLSKNYLREWGSNWYNGAPKEFISILGSNHVTPDLDEIVFASKVLAADVNLGYHNLSNWIVTHVNEKPIRNLRDLISIIESDTDSPYVEFKSSSGQMVVLDREKVASTHEEILELYRVQADRSSDLSETENGIEDAD
jgi:S1-C subfamily serine protease